MALINIDLQGQISKETTATYLALGDSYTIGEQVNESDRFPVQLVARLNELNFKLKAPKIIARTGWTTSDLIHAIDNAKMVNEKFDIVSLLIGVNNQYRNGSRDVYRKELKYLLERAIAYGKNNPKNIFVLSIPDWGITPFGKKSQRLNISSEIELFNKVLEEETGKLNISFIDISPISYLSETNSNLLARDGLHPSGEMYKLWVEKIVSSLLKK